MSKELRPASGAGESSGLINVEKFPGKGGLGGGLANNFEAFE
jgi:hypothetical protein